MIEQRRLEEVQKLLHVDFESTAEFGAITELAAQVCQVPFSFITLPDKHTTWIRAPYGISIDELPAETSFCRYVIRQDDVLLIPDTTKDHRFNKNEVVHGIPLVRFYAGVPLILKNGCRVGTLCLFDVKPGNLTEVQKKTLSVLSKQVVYLMELQVSRQQLLAQVQEITRQKESLRKIAQLQSHEIRQPLTSIIGLVSIVRDGLHKVDKHWLRMLGNVTDILDEKIHAIVNESMGNEDIKLMEFNKVVEEIEDYAILLLNKKGYLENWNAGAEKMNRYRAHEIVGKHFSVFYTATDKKKHLPQQLLEEARTKKTARNIGWRVRKDGSYFWASVVITCIKNGAGEVVGFLKVTRDLTDINEVKKSLDISEERNRRIIDEVEDYAIILLDTRGNVEKWNRGAQRIKGYSEEEILGKNFSVFYTEADNACGLPQTLLNNAVSSGRVRHEGWRVKKDGSLFWGVVVLTAIHDHTGNVIGFVKVTRETENKPAICVG